VIEVKVYCWKVEVGGPKLRGGQWKNLCEKAWVVRGEL